MKYFTISELTKTNRTIQNVPNDIEIANLTLLIENVLDQLRELYGSPIKVNSGYRCKMLNAAVGGAKNSDHIFGYAADITAGNQAKNKVLFELIKANIPAWRQLINEHNYSWLHISYNVNDNKKQILEIK